MTLARILLTASALSLLAAPGRQELRLLYPEGRALVFESSDWSTLEPVDVSARMNGEELPPEATRQIAAGFSAERKEGRAVSTTVIEETRDGRPVVVRRRYDALARTVRKGEDERAPESPLVGRTLRLRRGEDGAVAAELVSSEPAADIDPRHLEGHQLTERIEVLLPGREVAVGDRWELDTAAARELLGQEGAPRLFPDDLEKDAFRELMIERAETSAEVRYEADEERDGLACARLAVESTLALRMDEVDPELLGLDPAADGLTMEASFELEIRVRATLWLALEAGRPVARESEMDGRLVMDMSLDRVARGLTIRVESAMEGAEAASWTLAD